MSATCLPPTDAITETVVADGFLSDTATIGSVGGGLIMTRRDSVFRSVSFRREVRARVPLSGRFLQPERGRRHEKIET
jgi:hypothetical protein